MRPGGYTKIVDRKKDMIMVSGFNVYPNEVEEVVARHPGVLEARAVGVPDAKTGEAVKLVVVRKKPEAHRGRSSSPMRRTLPATRCRSMVEFRTDLPKTNVGKILRRELRDEKPKAAAAAAS